MKAHKFADIFPMMEKKDFENLKKDIEDNGFDSKRKIILFQGEILDGRNRQKACDELKVEPKYDEFKGTEEQALYYVISNNLNRRHLNESQRAMVGVSYKSYYAEIAKQRMIDAHSAVEPVPQQEQARARDKAGEVVGVSGKMVDMAESVMKEATKEEIADVKKGKTKVTSLYRKYKKKKQKKEVEKLVPEKKLQGTWDVIVVDPPWDYGNDENYDAESFRGTCPYPVMNINEIKKIKFPIGKDCILWLWTTNTFLHEAYHCLEEWGFEAKTVLTWDKVNIGIGRWLRSQTEHCILAVKGKPYFDNKKWSTLISEKRTTHSTKPEIFYKMVDEICAGRKLDYFARKKREGWDVYGDEIK